MQITEAHVHISGYTPASIAGIGVDVIRVHRIEGVLQRHSKRFVKRILGEQEIEIFNRRYARDPRRGVLFLATRFAAKEAFSKAVGLGMRQPMSWSRMQTVNAPSGKPMVVLADPLNTWYQQRYGNAHVTITDEADIVIAFVVIEALSAA